MQWLLVDIARNQRAQDKLRAELMRELGPNGALTEANLLRMPYLAAVIRETHRLTPVAPMTSFKDLAEDLEYGGVFYPKGTFTAIDSYSLQNNPALVEAPEGFRPERWLPDVPVCA